MPSERIVAVGLLTQKDVQLLGPTFDRIWPIESAPHFHDLLAAIDEADQQLGSEAQVEHRKPKGAFEAMANEAATFRTRAQDCRRLSALARDIRDRELLAKMAAELEAEADKIESEGAELSMEKTAAR